MIQRSFPVLKGLAPAFFSSSCVGYCFITVLSTQKFAEFIENCVLLKHNDSRFYRKKWFFILPYRCAHTTFATFSCIDYLKWLWERLKCAKLSTFGCNGWTMCPLNNVSIVTTNCFFFKIKSHNSWEEFNFTKKVWSVLLSEWCFENNGGGLYFLNLYLSNNLKK